MIRATAISICFATTASAADLTVVTDIPPVQDMVGAVLGSSPDVIVEFGASAHDFALAPSQARTLSQADLVVWVGPTLSPWLADPLETLAEEAVSLELLDVPGWDVLPMREGGHDHGDHDKHADHDEHDEHDDHDDHEEHGDYDEHDKDHDDHASEGSDPHAWLDPVVLAVWAGAVADQLSAIDPDNASTYAANADAYAASLDDVAAASVALDGLDGILFPHDGFQYLEARYGFTPVAYVTDGHDADPGPAHLAELRDMVEDGNITCILHDVGPVPGWVAALTDGAELPIGAINPMQPITEILATLEQTCAG